MSENILALTESLKSDVEHADCLSQFNNELISTIAKTIERLVDDDEVKSLLKHIDYLAQDTMNEVNSIAEILGANYVESSISS